MPLLKEHLQKIDEIYARRREINEAEHQRRIQEVYNKAPEVKDYTEQIKKLAILAVRTALSGKNTDALTAQFKDISSKKELALLSAGFPADYLDDIYICPKCKDTGYIGTDRCDCMTSVLTSILYDTSRLSEILKRENFDTFKFNLYSDEIYDENLDKTSSENIKSVVNYCHKFIDDFDKSFDNLLFYGKAGTGKTFLVNCIAKELIESSHSVIYLSAISLIGLLTDISYGRVNEMYGYLGKEELYNCDLLIIDDLGTEYTNSFVNSLLFDCLNERLIHQRSTIISTNLSPGEMQKRYEERIFSRIFGNYAPLKIFGDDIRIKLKMS